MSVCVCVFYIMDFSKRKAVMVGPDKPAIPGPLS